MTSKPQREPPNRAIDWATAATEARRQRDAEAKQGVLEQLQRRQQERTESAAWSPSSVPIRRRPR
ncbi:MAG TPA: hypothetical protein VGK33_15690 [Chloroflexota bacterium]|jgi:hypothetical protein